VSKAFTNACILFVAVCLLLAIIPASALASEIQPPQSKISSDSSALQEVMGNDAGVTARIVDIYWKDWANFGIWRNLEGVVLPSGIGTVDMMISWFNDSTVQVTGHIEATVTKPLGNIVSLPATGGQDTTLAPSESKAVVFDMIIDHSGSWVLDVTLFNKSDNTVLETLSVDFSVAGMSFAFEGNPRVCDTPPCSVTFTNLVTGGALPYQNAIWNFGDETEVQGEAVQFGETVTHNYTNPGFYSVNLKILDAEDVTTSRTKLDYITVGEGYREYTLNFPSLGYFPRHLPDDYFGQVVLDDLDPEGIPWQVQGIYHESGAYWAPPPAPAGDVPLDELIGGLHADYMISVASDCDWVIPLP